MNRFGAQTMLAATLLLIGANGAAAQGPAVPPAGPFTFWNKLGIPQGYQKIKDANINKRGNHPNWERKPKLKRIADPANLESKNKAIQKAAEIKAEEDLAPQKIKGIKYLASIGCGCYNRDGGITDALLAAMDDCTESVRLAAVEAISDAGECEECVYCKQKTCCTPAIAKRLEKMAYEQDDNGCWFEPSERVRAAAAEAAQVCSPKLEPNPVEPPKDPVTIPELPQEDVPRPEIPDDTPPTPPDSAKRKLPDLADKSEPTKKPEPARKLTRAIDPQPEAPARVMIEDTPSQMPRPIQQSVQVKSIKKPSATRTSRKEPAAPAEKSIWISDDKPSAVRINFKAPELDPQTPPASAARAAAAAPARASIVKLAEPSTSDQLSGAAGAMSVKTAPTSSSKSRPIQPMTIVGDPTGMPTSDLPSTGTIANIDHTDGTLRIRLNSQAIVPEGTRYHVSRDYLLGAAVLGQIEVKRSEPGFAIARPVGDLHAAQLSTTDAISLVKNSPR